MPDDGKNAGVVGRVVDGARFISTVIWFVAAVALPMAFLLRSYSVALLTVILLVFWQVLALGLSWLNGLPERGGRSFSRIYITKWGLVSVAVAAVFCSMAIYWGINLIYLTGAFLAGAVLCAAFFPLIMFSRNKLQVNVPRRVFAGERFPVQVELINGKRVLGEFGLDVRIELPLDADDSSSHHITRLPPGGKHTMLLQHEFSRRGLHSLPPITMTSSFPFGMFHAIRQTEMPDEVLVLPKLGLLEGNHFLHQRGGEVQWLMELCRKASQGDFRNMREYQYGDNPRHIHWPTSARLKKLHVREFEKQETHNVLLVLDAYASPDENSRAELADRFEVAVSFAATMASWLTKHNVLFGLASCCPEMVLLPHDTGTGHYYSVLEALALAKMTSEKTLFDLMDAVDLHKTVQGGVCLISAGPLPTAKVQNMLGWVARYTLMVDVSAPQFEEVFYV